MSEDEQVEIPDEGELIHELRYFQAHQMVALERIYDILIWMVDREANNGGKTAQALLERHKNHNYKWPEGG